MGVRVWPPHRFWVEKKIPKIHFHDNSLTHM